LYMLKWLNIHNNHIPRMFTLMWDPI
jgi:hypothetical protein